MPIISDNPIFFQVEISDFEKICNQGNSIIFSFDLMDQLCATTNSNKRSPLLEEIKVLLAAKENEEIQFKTFVSKVMNSINAARQLKTSSLYENEMKRVEKELHNKQTVFELNWSKEKQNIEESLKYSKYEIACKSIFDRVNDFLTTLKNEDEARSLDQIKKKLAKFESELKEKYLHGMELKDTISSQSTSVLLEEIEAMKKKLGLAKMRINEEEEFNHQIRCMTDQCKNVIKETNNQLDNWKLKITSQPINQSNKESLKEINRLLEEISKFKKNTMKTSDHLLRNINEKLSQKFGLKNSGILQGLENSLNGIISKIDLVIKEFVLVETNISKEISKAELEKKEKLVAVKEVFQKETTPPPRPPDPIGDTKKESVFVEREATPPPRPPDPVSDSGRDTRDHSPASRSTTSGRELGPETLALKTLAAFQRHSRPLNDLVPFPFLPDKQISKPKKNKTKVPKPSKFTKGEMYYSDYESDFDGSIGIRWRGAQSDTEDVDSSYRRVTPVLTKGFSQQSLDRKPSPPCPHQWESHEDIDQIQREIRNWNVLTRTVNNHKSSEIIINENSRNLDMTIDNADASDSDEPQYYEATAIVRCHSNMSNRSENQMSTQIDPTPSVPVTLTGDQCFSMKSVDSGSYSDENNITTTSLSTVQTTTSNHYMKVKEKVMHFEKKVEEEYIKLALEEHFGECPSSPRVRPERIPGAVRVLPTPTPPGSRPGSRLGSGLSSRKNSLTRSSSTENANLSATVNSASIISRSAQPSPLFGKRYQEHPPPKFVPPDFKSWDFMARNVPADTIRSQTSFALTDQHSQMKSPPPLEIVDSNEMSGYKNRYHPSQRRSRSRSILSEDEEPERLSSPKLVLMANNLAKRDSIDGYDGDTDTLKSRKGSVKRNSSTVHTAASSSQFITSAQCHKINKKESVSQSQITSSAVFINSTTSTQAEYTQSNGEDTIIRAKWLPQSVSDINQQPTYKSVKPCFSSNMSK